MSQWVNKFAHSFKFQQAHSVFLLSETDKNECSLVTMSIYCFSTRNICKGERVLYKYKFYVTPLLTILIVIYISLSFFRSATKVYSVYLSVFYLMHILF